MRKYACRTCRYMVEEEGLTSFRREGISSIQIVCIRSDRQRVNIKVFCSDYRSRP